MNCLLSACASLPFWSLKPPDAGIAEGRTEEDAGEGAEAGEAEAAPPEPVKPPVAPVAAIRAKASAVVVQVMEVPAVLTRGRAAHIREPAQGLDTNFPPTHWAKAAPTQAF